MIGGVSQAFTAYAETLRAGGQDRSEAGSTAESSIASFTGADSQIDGGTGGADFGNVLSQAIDKVVSSSHQAENMAAQGLSGGGDTTQIVTAVANAQLALQTTTVLRDRFVTAYQDVMRMAI